MVTKKEGVRSVIFYRIIFINIDINVHARLCGNRLTVTLFRQIDKLNTINK